MSNACQLPIPIANCLLPIAYCLKIISTFGVPCLPAGRQVPCSLFIKKPLVLTGTWGPGFSTLSLFWFTGPIAIGMKIWNEFLFVLFVASRDWYTPTLKGKADNNPPTRRTVWLHDFSGLRLCS